MSANSRLDPPGKAIAPRTELDEIDDIADATAGLLTEAAKPHGRISSPIPDSTAEDGEFLSGAMAAAMNLTAGQELRRWRCAAGYSLRAASPLVDVSYSQLSRIERMGFMRPPKRSFLRKVARAYGVPFDEVLDVVGMKDFVVEAAPLPEAEQFAALMLHETFGPGSMKPEFLPHFPALHRKLVLELFARAWAAGVEFGKAGVGPTPSEVLGDPGDAVELEFPIEDDEAAD
jgi:transcriptional regulator with XRE-family HTH domain